MERQVQGVTTINRWVLYVLFAGMLMGLALLLLPGPVQAQSGSAARDDAAQAVSFRVEPAIADLRKKGRGKGFWLMGAGLKPGQKVAVYVTMLGAASDISFMLRPRAKANAEGVLITSWEIRPRRFARVFSDQLTFELRDPKSLKLLATAPVAVCRGSKGKGKGKAKAAPWCKAAQPLLVIMKKKKKKKRKKKKSKK